MLNGDFCKGSELGYQNPLSHSSWCCWQQIQPDSTSFLQAGARPAALWDSDIELGSFWL